MSSDPLPSRDSEITWRPGTAPIGPSTGRSTRLTRCAVTAIRFPVRSKNGTSRQRSVSTHRRAATKVSVVEPGGDAVDVAIAVELAQDDVRGRVQRAERREHRL